MAGYDEHTALIVVDMQNDFADPSGSLTVNGGDRLVGVVNAEIVRAVAGDALVVYTADWHPPSTPHFATDGGVWPVHCVADTWGAEFHPRLLVAGPVVRKGVGGEDGYSGFTVVDPSSGEESATELQQLLDSNDIGSIVVVGLALDYCVKATALDGVRLGFTVALPERLTAAVDLAPGDGAQALELCRAAGVHVT